MSDLEWLLAPTPPKAATANRMRLVWGDQIKIEPVRWLIPGLVPMGALTLLAGEPGLGKSTVAMDWSARVTTGTTGGDLGKCPATVVMMSAEDSPAHTLLPRFMACGGDQEEICFQDVDSELMLPRDTDELAGHLVATGASMLVLDPLVPFLGGIDSHKDASVRTALAPLASIAAELDVAVVLVVHTNKSQGTNAVHRVGGSIGFVGAARSAVFVARDPQAREDPEARVLFHGKSNLGPPATPKRFGVVAARVNSLSGAEVLTSRTEWRGEAPDISEGDVFAAPTPDGGNVGAARSNAAQFLRELLAEGPMPVETVTELASQAGHSWRTIERAKKTLGVESIKGSFQEGWLWLLGDAEGRQAPPKAAAADGWRGSAGVGGLGDEGRPA